MKPNRSALIGHLLALFTIIIWGSTFIFTKMLLNSFTPLQVMLLRFAIAYIALWLIHPKWTKTNLKKELPFLALGLTGCTLYFLAENYALSYTQASNVSILVASAPLFTAILAHFFVAGERLHRNVWLGFIVAFAGVALVVFNGTILLKLSPIGDILALLAALCWAVYSVLLKRQLGDVDNIVLTRKIMFYGFITACPILLLDKTPFAWSALVQLPNLAGILFLGLIGSGACYVTWNLATQRLGVVSTNNYIYINPFVTMLTALLFLNENITWMGFVGAILIISGVILSGKRRQTMN